jgi:hypothetical protein
MEYVLERKGKTLVSDNNKQTPTDKQTPTEKAAKKKQEYNTITHLVIIVFIARLALSDSHLLLCIVLLGELG